MVYHFIVAGKQLRISPSGNEKQASVRVVTHSFNKDLNTQYSQGVNQIQTAHSSSKGKCLVLRSVFYKDSLNVKDKLYVGLQAKYLKASCHR